MHDIIGNRKMPLEAAAAGLFLGNSLATILILEMLNESLNYDVIKNHKNYKIIRAKRTQSDALTNVQHITAISKLENLIFML